MQASGSDGELDGVGADGSNGDDDDGGGNGGSNDNDSGASGGEGDGGTRLKRKAKQKSRGSRGRNARQRAGTWRVPPSQQSNVSSYISLLKQNYQAWVFAITWLQVHQHYAMDWGVPLCKISQSTVIKMIMKVAKSKGEVLLSALLGCRLLMPCCSASRCVVARLVVC
jgi:hypothetical protein